MDIWEFDECLKEAGNEDPKHLLLGNGFSLGFYGSFSKEEIKKRFSPKTRELLTKLGMEDDFEGALHELVRQLGQVEKLEIIQAYDPKITEKLKEDIENVKKEFIKNIIDLHPPNEKDDSLLFDSCCKFLSNFNRGSLFTLNYDSIIYWIKMHGLNGALPPIKDGFGGAPPSYKGFEEGYVNNIYYLHGALHIYDDNLNTYKVPGGKNIREFAKKRIDEEGKFPLFVLEGTSEEKIRKIIKNEYLRNAFYSLTDIKGNLFIYGLSLADQDDHIFDAINTNKKIKKIFISYYDDADKKRAGEKVGEWREKYKTEGREYTLYDAASANVWGKASNDTQEGAGEDIQQNNHK